MKGIFIFVFLLFSTLPVHAYAQVDEGSISAELQVTTPSEYFLPYPGMLPDSPLYFLKATRDRIIGFLISDQAKKADFHLLQADKSIQSGLLLIKKEKTELGMESLEHAKNYFADAVTEAEGAQKQKKDVNDLLRKLPLAGVKHQALLLESSELVSGDNKKKVLEYHKAMEELTEKASALLPE